MNEGGPRISRNDDNEGPKDPSRRRFLGKALGAAAVAATAGVVGRERIADAVNAVGEKIEESDKKMRAEKIKEFENHRSQLKTFEEVVRGGLDHLASIAAATDDDSQHWHRVTYGNAGSLLRAVDEFNVEAKVYESEGVKPYEFTFLTQKEIQDAREWDQRHWEMRMKFQYR